MAKQKIRLPGGLPWFMWDIANRQLITSVAIPTGDIKDSKAIILTETPIPGRNFQPVSPGGNGNRKISFTLPILSRLTAAGNIHLLAQFETLRNQATGFLGMAALKGQFSPNPKVLFQWGTASPVPLEYFVSKCDFSHTANMVNAAGMPQMTSLDIELILDETSPLYQAEVQFRQAAVLLGETMGGMGIFNQRMVLGSPF